MTKQALRDGLGQVGLNLVGGGYAAKQLHTGALLIA